MLNSDERIELRIRAVHVKALIAANGVDTRISAVTRAVTALLTS